MIVAINPGRSYSMETAQDGQPGNSQVPKRVHRWTLLLRSSMLIMILSVVTMDLLLLYFHNIIDTSWFSGFLLALTIIGGAFSIAQLFYLWSFSNSFIGHQLPPVAPSLSTESESPMTSPLPSTDEPVLSPMPPVVKTTYRSIAGVVPLTDPRTIVPREKVVRDIYRRLIRSDTTAIVLTGMAGVGESTLAALVYHYVGRQHSGSSFFVAKPFWLTIDTDVTMTELAGNIFEALGKPMPDCSSMTAHSQAVALFKLINTADRPGLIVLDEFENLLDWRSGDVIADPAIRNWLTALNSEKCKCRVLFTSRSWPQQIHPPTYIQEYRLGGLESNEGIELLRKQGVQGTEEGLHEAVKYCGGHPFALALLASLVKNHQLSLDALFKDRTDTQLWVGDIASNLLNYIYKRELNEEEHKLLLAFSVYREPVSLEAVRAIGEFTTKVSKAQIQAILKMLVAQHLLQSSGGGRYHLHPIVANYIQRHFVEDDEQANQQALREAHARAAHYYRQQAASKCPPPERRQDISDVHVLIEAIWQYCYAEQWQEAYDLMEREAIFTDLKRWGENTILLELYEMLLPLEKWQPKASQAIRVLTNLGRVYRTRGQRNQARVCLERALEICEKEEDRWVKGMVLSFLGRVYADLGQKKTALKYLTQALDIRKEIDDFEGASWTLDTLGEIYDDLGQMELAREFSERALKLREEVGDRRGIGRTLITLGRVYDNLGQTQQARRYLEQALLIWKEVKDRTGEALTLNRLGLLYAGLRKKDQALKYYDQALSIEREIGDRGGEARTLNHLGNLYSGLGESERALHCLEQALSLSQDIGDSWLEGRILTNLGMVYYERQEQELALEYLEKALTISINAGDQRGEAWTKYNLGQVYVDLGERQRALKYFEEAWHIYRRVGNRRREGGILYNIGLLYFKWQGYEVALASLLLARNIFRELESPDVFETENYIGKLHEQVGEERFTTLLAQVEPQAQQIVEQALHEAV